MFKENTKKYEKRSQLLGVFALASLMSLSSAEAFFVDPQRCEHDSIDQNQVLARNQWFKRCKPELYDMVYSEGDEFTFNKIHYQRRLYVTFGVPKAGGGFDYPGNWMAPIDANAGCDTPVGYKAIGVCTSGCYLPDQKLMFPGGEVEIKKAMNLDLAQVVTLTENSTQRDVHFKFTPVHHFMASISETQHELLEFLTLDGGSLIVTPDHPLVDSQGRIRRADTFERGEALVKANGDLDPIVVIVGKTEFGKVYNLAVQSQGDLENVVVAQGFLNGTLHYQNAGGVSKLNQVIFRQSVLPQELVE